MRTKRALFGLILIGSLLSGCGSYALAAGGSTPTTSSSPSPTGAPKTTPDTVVLIDRNYPQGNIRLAPPPNGKQPSISSDLAYKNCQTGVAPCPRATPTSSELASFSDDAYGQIQPDQSVRLSFQNTLSWVFTWKDATCPPGGGNGAPAPGATSFPLPLASPALCDWVVFIDATTGQYQLSYQGPPPSY